MLAAALVLGLLGAICYANSLRAPFVFDGINYVEMEPSVRGFDSLDLLFERARTRPVGFLTFAANYAWNEAWKDVKLGGRPLSGGGYSVESYHVVNIAIHLAAGWLLFGLVRRTLELPETDPRLREAALPLAFIASAWWLLHPLQTQSVTYLYQRFESLAGMFYLATLYGLVRGTTGSDPLARLAWFACAVAACVLGMLTKETVATAPLVALWFDRVFLASSWDEVFRRRGGLHACLAACWLPLLAVMPSVKWEETGVLVVAELSADEYAVNQPAVILHYLRMAFWPGYCPLDPFHAQALCLDYSWPVERDVTRLLPSIVALSVLVAAIAWVACRWPRTGFLLGSWLVILGPTSSVLPIRDLCFEHRMYLPLAPLAVAAALAWYRAALACGARLGGGVAWRLLGFFLPALAVVVALGLTTMLRNLVYVRESSVWADTAIKAPHNSRAFYNLGVALYDDTDYVRAERAYRQALELKPSYTEAWTNLGIVLHAQGRTVEGIEALHRALEVSPQYALALLNLGDFHAFLNETDTAETYYRRAIETPEPPALAHNNYGYLLMKLDRLDEAREQFQRALAREPGSAMALNNLQVVERIEAERQAATTPALLAEWHLGRGRALVAFDQPDRALPHLDEAVRLAEGTAAAWLELGRCRLQLGQARLKAMDTAGPEEAARLRDQAESLFAAAAEALARSLELEPQQAAAHYELANALRRLGRFNEAIEHLQQTLALDPAHAEANNNLGIFLAREGKHAEAAAHYLTAIRSRPDYAEAHNNLANALVRLGRVGEAVVHYRRALEIQPDYPEARQNLEQVLAGAVGGPMATAAPSGAAP